MTSGALAFRERRLRQVRMAHVLAATGGLATLIGGGYLIDSFSPGALLACVAGLAALAGGVVLARRLAQTVRYRIDKPNSTAVLAGKVATLLAVLVGAVVVLSAVDAPSAPRSVIVLVLVGSLAAVVSTHAARWTLFQIDATGMKLGQAGVPWPAAARLDLASAGPGFVEIGVQLVAGQVVSGRPAPGRVLADLPVCTVVPESAVDVARIRWAVREFGNPAVPVVVRDHGPQQPPPRQPTPPAGTPAPAPVTPPADTPLSTTETTVSLAHPAPPAADTQPPAPGPPTPPPGNPSTTSATSADTGSPRPDTALPGTSATPQPGNPTTPPADTQPPHSLAALPDTPATLPPSYPTTTPPLGKPATSTADAQQPHPDPPATPPPGNPTTPPPHTPPPGVPATSPPGSPAYFPHFPTTSPPPPPAPRRRGWVIAGAVAIVAVLVAGAVTVISLQGGDEPGRATAADTDAGPRYSAANVEEPCDLIDVYVLKRWSTVTDIATEPSTDRHTDYDYLHCRAYSDSEYVVGRVTHLEMLVAVAESADAARRFQTEQEKQGLWTVTGDVSDDGTVPRLAESAEFEQAMSTYADHTRADYVLRLRDDNLVFFLKFGSDADQSDGPGVTVQTLADTAHQQARAAMEKLRTRPSDTKGKSEPAALPKTIHDAVTLPGTQDLMARIRGADPCELHDREFPATFGSVSAEPHQALGLAECRLMATSGAVRVVFGIELNEYLSEEDRADLVREGKYFHDKVDPSGNGCSYYVPFENTGFGASVSVARYVPGVEDQEPWPDACEVAGEYTAQVGERIAALPARSKPAPEPTLIGKDPCLADEISARLLPDWKLGPVSRYYSAQCWFTMRQGDDVYEFRLSFDRDAEQIGDAPANVGGLNGVWIKFEGQCSLSLVYVPETTPDAWDAHNIGASVQWKGLGDGPLDECTLAQAAAEMVIDSV